MKILMMMSFLVVAPLVLAMAAPRVVFEGRARACAGGVENEVHQLRLRVRGFRPHQRVDWSFEAVTRRDDKGRALRVPRFWDGAAWREAWTTRADARGRIALRVLSGQAVEKPRLVARWRGQKWAERRCDFGAPEAARRFLEPFAFMQGQWAPPGNDSGYLFDGGLADISGRENGKIYLKFRLDSQRGDVDGNWRFVNGHGLRVQIASVGFNVGVIRSDGAAVTVLTRPQDTAPYATIAPRTRFITTRKDGAASFVMLAGRKFQPADDFAAALPQVTAQAQDITIYQKAAPAFAIPLAPNIGAPLQWFPAAQKLRGALLWRAPQERNSLKIIDFDARGRRESALAVGGGDYQWAPSGARFRVTMPTDNEDVRDSVLFERSEKGAKRLLEIPTSSGWWGVWSPSGRQYLFESGSDERPWLQVWNGGSEVKLPLDGSFSRTAFPRAVWNGESEIWASQMAAKAEPRIVRVAARSQARARLWMERAWNPLVSPDGKMAAFFGPESARQKTTHYWSEQPLDQPLCVARPDKKPFPDRKFGFGTRRPLDRFGADYPALFWTRDSRFLIAARAVSDGESPWVEVWRYRVANGTRHLIARFDYAIPRQRNSDEVNAAQWHFDGLSRDEKALFLTFEQQSEAPKTRAFLQTRQWFRLDVASGKLEKLAVFRGADFAWHDQSSAAR